MLIISVDIILKGITSYERLDDMTCSGIDSSMST